MKIYSGIEIAEMRRPIQSAAKISEMGGKIKQVIQEQLINEPASQFDVLLINTESVLDFRLSTPFGWIYAQHDLVRVGLDVAGRYTFFYETRDNQGNEVKKPIFVLLYQQDGNYQFGDQLGTEGFVPLTSDFSWKLAGNILKSLYVQLEVVATRPLDISQLGKN